MAWRMMCLLRLFLLVLRLVMFSSSAYGQAEREAGGMLTSLVTLLALGMKTACSCTKLAVSS